MLCQSFEGLEGVRDRQAESTKQEANETQYVESGHEDRINMLQLRPEQAIESAFEQDDRDLAIPMRHGRPQCPDRL